MSIYDFVEFARRAIYIYTFSNHNGDRIAATQYKNAHLDKWDESAGAEFLKAQLGALFKARTCSRVFGSGSLIGDTKVSVNARLDMLYG